MPLYDDASIMFLASGAARTDTAQGTAQTTGSGSGGIFSKAQCIKPVEVLTSTEILQNTDFSIDGGGTGGALEDTVYGAWGWNHTDAQGTDASSKITGGVLTLSNGTDGDAFAYATTSSNTRNILTENATYKLNYTITASNITQPEGAHSLVGYWGGNYKDIPQTVGTHSVIMVQDTAGSNELFLFRLKGDNDEVSIDNVSIKKVTTAALSFDMTRDANLDATRVGPNGLIEKGREQLLLNTTFSGGTSNTSVPGFTLGGVGGTFGVANASGQLTFTASNETKRRYLVSPTQSTTSCLYTQSVFVDAVEGTVELDEIMRSNSASNTTLIHNLEDGVRVDGSTIIQAGKRYSRTYTLDSSTTVFRFGIGTNPLSHPGAASVTLSKPQLEKGVTSTAYIENTSTSATVIAGINDDEPRFDYPPLGGPPSLLIEPQRQNKFAQSEYLTGLFNPIRTTFEHNEATSPEGVNNAVFIAETATGTTHGFQFIDFPIVDGTFYSISFFVKANGREKFFFQCNDETVLAMSVTVDLSGTPSASDGAPSHTGSEQVIDYGNGWYRVEINAKEGLATSSDKNLNFFFIEDASGTTTSYTGDPSKGLLFYGLQIEEGKNCTSYIPTYGTVATRSADTVPEIEHGIDFDTTISVFLEASKFNADSQTSFLQLRTGTDSNNRLLFFSNTSAADSTHDVQVQHRESGTPINRSISGVTRGDFFKILARVDGTTFTAFINGQKITGDAVVAADIYDKISFIRNGDVTTQSGHKIKSVIVFDDAVSDADAFVLTDTSYESYSEAADSLNYIQHG